ncbi:MAG: cytidylyltransferase domain-containing protein [Lachnospiraceae bacterium]
MKKKVVAIMPIKLKNERLPGKNTKLLGEKPLISYALETLEQVEEIDELYVYCSDEAICPYLTPKAKFLKRDKTLDLPTSNFTQIFDTFQKQVDADVYVYAHATAPFVQAETIREVIGHVTSGEYDSAFTAEKIQDFLWENGAPLNFDAENVPRSQDIVPIYRETSGVYAFEKEVFTKYRRRIGVHACPVEVSKKECVDINYPEDFQMAELFLQCS